MVAYDRRGYGQTPPSAEPFSHLDDLLAVIGHAGVGPVWLAGASPEGRVGGAARKLALDMNAIIIGSGVPETAGATGVDAWHRLAEIKVPVTVACGDLDSPIDAPVPQAAAAARNCSMAHGGGGCAAAPYRIKPRTDP